jgi:hypothetical protein
MKRLLIPVLMMLLMLSVPAIGQTILDNFDNAENDTVYTVLKEGSSTMTYTNDKTTFVEGTGSLRIKAVIAPDIHTWGSYTTLQRKQVKDQYFDLSARDTLRMMIKIVEPPVAPANVVFRFHLMDQPSPTDNIEEYIFQDDVILDAASDWVEIKAPLIQRETDTGDPNNTGFILFPGSWGRSASGENNKIFDLNKITGFNITFVTTTAAADSIVYNIDDFKATGNKAISAIVFNGVQFPTTMEGWSWGQSSLEIVDAAELGNGMKAIKWVQGDEWGSGWSGIGCTSTPPADLSGAWAVDSMKIKMKVAPGVDTLRLQLEGGAGKVAWYIDPIDDDQWHEYSFPLKGFVPSDNTTGFDSSKVGVFGIMAEANSKVGNTIYITNWWTGTPAFDVLPPAQATDVSGIADTYQNLVTWTDVAGEDNEKYDIYYSTSPITDISAKGVEVVETGVNGGVNLVTHLLRAPKNDQSVTYYYAIVCRDAAGNVGNVSASSAPVTNTAKGVPVIEPKTVTFAADGDLAEWQGITPIDMAVSKGTAYIPSNNVVDGDKDLSLLIYLAMDENYLYAAFDVEDDVVTPDISTDSYKNDCPDIFIGLYDWHGLVHNSLQRGAQPDYHIRFNKAKAIFDGGGISRTDSLLLPGADYYWGEKFPTGYVVEARISLDTLAARGKDTRFRPTIGNRIPLDFSINDADGAPREGILCYSIKNDDHSYETPARWTYTWVGDQWTGVADDKNIALDSYQLLQNYPNPFNPTTQISYVLQKQGMVTVKIFDVLGREVKTLVNQEQTTGLHTVNFDASGLASGMYIYKIDAGSFHSSKKMLLLK